jgi:predicted TPR repeat methyltransferase
MTASLFLSSGDLVADRRYDYAVDLAARGDDAAAADLFAQAAEVAPHFASAWFALAECCERLNQHDDAVSAYRAALSADPADRHGAKVRLMRLGVEPLAEMPQSYVRALFDQYAPRFDEALVKALNYRAPDLLREAVVAVRPDAHFCRGYDLGCGTGLAGRAFASDVDEMIGVDLSREMIARARASGCYAVLHVSDMLTGLRAERDASCDLILAADALVYLADLSPLLREASRVLSANGLLAFTVETHAEEGVTLGAGLRYAHAEAYVREALRDADLEIARLDRSSTRDEAGTPVPGLVIVASRRG